MHTPLKTAEDYLDVWNEVDPDARRRRLDAWHPDARYSDPLMQAQGRNAMAAMITSAREQFPGLVFRLRGAPDGHGSFARFSWTLGPVAGSFVAAGSDVIRCDEKGRIVEVIGFLDEVRS